NVHMNVRKVAAPGVTAPTEDLTALHALADLHADCSALKVRQENKASRCDRDYNVVAGRVVGVLNAERVVGKTIDDSGYVSVRGCQDGLSPGVEALRSG